MGLLMALYHCSRTDKISTRHSYYCISKTDTLTLKLPDKLQPYVHVLYVYYVVHICDFGMLRVKCIQEIPWTCFPQYMVYVRLPKV